MRKLSEMFFSCCSRATPREQRYSLDDVKIDSEVSDVAGSTVEKSGAKNRSRSRFLSPGMVKMTIAQTMKSAEKSKSKSFIDESKKDRFLQNKEKPKEERTNPSREEVLLLPASKNSAIPSKLFLKKNSQPGDLSNKNETPLPVDTEDILVAYSEIMEEIEKQDNRKARSTTELKMGDNLAPFTQIDKAQAKNDTRMVESYLQEASLESEIYIEYSESEISCWIDFNDRNEFNRLLLKKIQDHLKK